MTRRPSVTRTILILAACLTLLGCSRFEAGSVDELLGNHSQDHPLNGVWLQLQSPEGNETNRIHFNRVPTSSNDRIGTFSGRIEGGETVSVDFEWLSNPAFTFAGPVELRFNQRDARGPDSFDATVITQCAFEVSADRTQLDFGRGCELFLGSYTKQGQPLEYGDRLWRAP